MTHDVEPRFLLLEGAPGRPAIANRIVGWSPQLRGNAVPMIPYPGFGFLSGIHVSGGISGFSAAMNVAIDEFKISFHVRLSMEASAYRCFTAKILHQL